MSVNTQWINRNFKVLFYVCVYVMYQYAQTNSQAQSRKPHNGIKQQELCEKILFFQVYLVQDKGIRLSIYCISNDILWFI